MIPGPVGLVILGADALLAATLTSTRAGAVVAAVVAALCLPVPVFTAASPLEGAFLGIAFFLVLARTLDLVRRAPIAGFGRRLLHLVLVVDTRSTRPAARLPANGLATVAWVAVTAAAWNVIRAPDLDLARPVLWVVAGFGIVGMFEGTHGLVALLARTARWNNVPPLSLQPYRSTTLTEFWGRRWNPVVSGLLREHCFQPLSRRPHTALLAAFVASALLHGYLGAVSLDARMAASLGLFFAVQPPLLLAERKLGVRRWPQAAGSAWTIGLLALLWPLIAEPLVRLLSQSR